MCASGIDTDLGYQHTWAPLGVARGAVPGAVYGPPLATVGVIALVPMIAAVDFLLELLIIGLEALGLRRRKEPRRDAAEAEREPDTPGRSDGGEGSEPSA